MNEQGSDIALSPVHSLIFDYGAPHPGTFEP